jgi:hypothetical protein
MVGKVRSHILGNAVGYVALFVALSGTAYAATSLPPGSVGTGQLKRGAVTRAKLAAHAVNGSKVAAHSLTGRQINAATLATVPRATAAVTASTAISATHAATADTATTATNAATASVATKLGSVTLVRTDGPALPSNQVESLTAFCLAGQQPIGGGGRADASNADDAIVSSRPAVPGNTTAPATGAALEGWQISVVNHSTTDIHPSAWVICAS